MQAVMNDDVRSYRGVRGAQKLVAMALCLFLGACTQNAADATVDASDNTRPNDADRAAPAISQSELRAEYPGLNGGESCTNDSICDSPLRCISNECRFPEAMSGEATEDTPYAIIRTERGEQRYNLELAKDLAEQKRGLMDRRHMSAEFGMLFVYDTPKPQSFWMKNTLISLDMLFIQADGRVESIVEHATPKSLTPRSSEGKVQYVLELIGGESARAGIQPGDRVEFFGLSSDEAP